MIRVLLADDHTMVRTGLKEILADTGDIAWRIPLGEWVTLVLAS